jgi:hypothetical protein
MVREEGHHLVCRQQQEINSQGKHGQGRGSPSGLQAAARDKQPGKAWSGKRVTIWSAGSSKREEIKKSERANGKR